MLSVQTPPAQLTLAELNVETLRRLASSPLGYEGTVQLLHQTLRSTAPHAEFIRQVESCTQDDLQTLQERVGLVVIVPGAGYREAPWTGADGSRVIQICRAAGLATETIPIRSIGALEDNAGIICDWLARRKEPRMTLISSSKGSADIKVALAKTSNHSCFRQVRAWLSLGGIMFGSPLVAWLQKSPVRHFILRQWMRFHGSDPAVLATLGHGAGGVLDGPAIVPPWMRVVHLVAMPMPWDITWPLARRGFARVRPYGPNDAGGLLLGDLVRFPGSIFPLLHRDHYLRTCEELPLLLQKLLFCAAAGAGE